MELLFQLGVRSPVSYVYVQQIQPRFQGLFPGFGVGWEKALASAGHMPTLHNQKCQNHDGGETVYAFRR